MCPGNDESAGKRRSGKTRKGNPWLRAALIEAAQAAARKKGRTWPRNTGAWRRRRGKQKAAVAVGHTHPGHRLPSAHPGTDYEDLGGNYFDERDRHAVKRRLVRRLEDLGY